jgi:hypothetical protein
VCPKNITPYFCCQILLLCNWNYFIDCLFLLPTDVRNLLQLFRMFLIREYLPFPLQHHLHLRPRRHLRPIRANISGRNFTEESGALSNQSVQSRNEMAPTAHLVAQWVVALRQGHV